MVTFGLEAAGTNARVEYVEAAFAPSCRSPGGCCRCITWRIHQVLILGLLPGKPACAMGLPPGKPACAMGLQPGKPACRQAAACCRRHDAECMCMSATLVALLTLHERNVVAL